MTRSAILKGALAGAILFASGIAIVDCSHREANNGAMKFDLKVSTSAQIYVVTYMISGNGIAPVSGSIDVSKTMTASTTVQGIPAGKKYQVQLDAATGDELVTCTGSTEVDVIAGKTSNANVIMQCSDTRSTGTVTIKGKFDNCPTITSFVAMPMSAAIGVAIDLQAAGLDLDGDPLTFRWMDSAGIGAVGTVFTSSSRAATSTFTCATAGMTNLKVVATDGNCSDTASIPITCGPAPSGGSGGATTPGGGTGSGGNPGGSGSGAGPGSATGSGNSSGSVSGNASGTGAGMETGTGGALMGMTGAGGVLGAAGMNGAMGGAPSGGGTCTSSHCAGQACDDCTNTNCVDAANLGGCDSFSDAADKKLCEDLYTCAVNDRTLKASDGSLNCIAPTNQGDLIPCWCGTNPTTCVSANQPPTMANGPCLQQVIAAAKLTPQTYDAHTVKTRLVDPVFPLGKATNLLSCRGNFCNAECNIP